jgi:UDP-N-acetylmuramate dehydrogenase
MVAGSSRQIELAAADLRGRIRGRVRIGEPMAQHTTFRIGGAADLFVEPIDVDDLATRESGDWW